MTWLITGGAGYIGAHLVRALQNGGIDVAVVDDLSTGERERVPNEVPLIRGDLLQPATLDEAFSRVDVTGVAHIAAKKRVDESVNKPSMYYQMNVEALRVLLDECVAHEVPNFLFSSSAAVYGETTEPEVDETSACLPANPYGETKLAGEWLTHAVGTASGMNTIALRYFNVAGAAIPELSERNAANVIPLVLQALHLGQPPVIYGDDYPTPDGTCIRDYVHVADIADAHVAAIRALEGGNITSDTLNIGTGVGASVKEVVDTACDVSGVEISPRIAVRRPGDPPAVVASVRRAATVLGWRARHDLREMISSAWAARSLESHAG